MSDRTDLIERAAARLRASVNTAPVGVEPPPPQPKAPPAAPLHPLSRQITLDRGYLAERGILMPWTSTARVVEEFRIIKRNIMAAWQSQGSPQTADIARVVMVTSARPREGKTFSSINLALAFAAEEEFMTILIDGDTVRGDTARTLQLPAAPGFAGILSGELTLADVLVQSDIPNLAILPPGVPGPHIPELLSGPAPRNLVGAIAKRYPNHVIVMDTPPCLASTDPAALAAIADQVVFVVEATRTQRPEIEAALNLISRCQNINFILNLVPVGASEHFGSYSYYYQPSKQ